MLKNLKKAKFNLQEISGAFGDIGTFLPLLLALSSLKGISFSSSLFFAGFSNFITGILYSIPIAVQPMKVIAVEVLSSNSPPSTIFWAGLFTSIVLFILSISNLLDKIAININYSIIYAIKFYLAIKLLSIALNLIHTENFTPLILFLLLLSFILALLNLKFKIPSALLIFLLCILISLNKFYISFLPPNLLIPPISSLYNGFKISLNQIPLTFLNSILLVIIISKELFPPVKLSAKKLTFTLLFINSITFLFSSIPFCHGAGGLVAQYKFGSRTNGSIIFLGITKMFMALFLGGFFLFALNNSPKSILSPLLLITSIEFIKGYNKLRNFIDYSLFIVCLFISIYINIFCAFLISLCLEKIMLFGKGFLYERQNP